MADILVSVSLGLFGLFAGGIFSIAAASAMRARRAPVFGAAPSRLTVLIPAHQEERALPATLASVKAAAASANVELRLVVGADGCTDLTEHLAAEAGAEVKAYFFRSKWKTLAELAALAQAGEWVALVDAGAVWPESLLRDLSPLLRDEALLGIAPAYFPAGASWIERALWSVEARWKAAENRAGGPVSAHGATIFYRAAALQAALAFLARTGRESWLNDDVVLPFTARRLFPSAELMYWCPSETSRRVSDVGLREDTSDRARRRRITAGNLEWAIGLLPGAAFAAPAVALVGMRRLLRIFWGYWILLLVYAGAAIALPARDLALVAAAAAVILGCLAAAAAGRGRIVEALAASLLSPLILVQVLRGRSRAWS